MIESEEFAMKKGFLLALSTLAGAVAGVYTVGRKMEKKIDYKAKMSDKHLALFLMMNEWVRIKQENKSIAEYLEKEGYKEIAVYGMNYAGETLVRELAGSAVDVKYGIDRNADNICTEINVVTPEEELAKVDAVIVTAIAFFDEIEEQLSAQMDCPVLSLEDILYEM